MVALDSTPITYSHNSVKALLLIFVAGCGTTVHVDVSPQTHENPAVLDRLVLQVHEKVNAHRATKNLPALRLDARINKIARRHSAAMAQNVKDFNHRGFDSRVRAIRKALPYRAAAENLAYNHSSDPATSAMHSWLQSKDHREALEGQFTITGIGVAITHNGRYYFTQLFVLPLR